MGRQAKWFGLMRLGGFFGLDKAILPLFFGGFIEEICFD
jgi:hypothetical protein